jgi:hypothetical protein
MIAPLEQRQQHESAAEDRVERFGVPTESPTQWWTSPAPMLDSARDLIGRHPLVSIITGVAVGVAAGWLLKQGRRR